MLLVVGGEPATKYVHFTQSGSPTTPTADAVAWKIRIVRLAGSIDVTK